MVKTNDNDSDLTDFNGLTHALIILLWYKGIFKEFFLYM